MSRLDTWMPLYIGDYLADTMRLSLLEHGAYLLLLMEYWRQGPLPDDDRQLAAVCRTDVKVFKRDLSACVRRFFVRGEDGLLHQKRMDAERARAALLSQKRAAAGSKGGSKRQAIASDLPPDLPPDLPEQKGDFAPLQLQSQIQKEESKKEPRPPSEVSPPAKREAILGSRLPADWQPTPEMRAFAIQAGLDPDQVAPVFRDFWCAKPGKEGRKADWSGTWRNWCRKDAERRYGARPASFTATAKPLSNREKALASLHCDDVEWPDQAIEQAAPRREEKTNERWEFVA